MKYIYSCICALKLKYTLAGEHEVFKAVPAKETVRRNSTNVDTLIFSKNYQSPRRTLVAKRAIMNNGGRRNSAPTGNVKVGSSSTENNSIKTNSDQLKKETLVDYGCRVVNCYHWCMQDAAKELKRKYSMRECFVSMNMTCGCLGKAKVCNVCLARYSPLFCLTVN